MFYSLMLIFVQKMVSFSFLYFHFLFWSCLPFRFLFFLSLLDTCCISFKINKVKSMPKISPPTVPAPNSRISQYSFGIKTPPFILPVCDRENIFNLCPHQSQINRMHSDYPDQYHRSYLCPQKMDHYLESLMNHHRQGSFPSHHQSA